MTWEFFWYKVKIGILDLIDYMCCGLIDLENA